MTDLNPYAHRVLVAWRERAAARGEHRNRIVPAAIRRTPPDSAELMGRGCVGCFRDARTLRAVGHRPGCVMREMGIGG